MKRLFEKCTNWESWPFYVLYFPLGITWLWYCLKSRSVWFFSPSNPSLTFGGFEGESKREMYDQLPPGSFPHTMYINPQISLHSAFERIQAAGFHYPFIVKPDVGMKGILFRKIDFEEQLAKYHQRIPVSYIVQDLIEFPIEVSIFYYRHPDTPTGTISGFIQKELLEVTGNGTSTLWELILQHPRAKLRLEEMRHRHANRIHRILPAGEHFYLSYAGNHNRGARFINLHAQIDDQLLQVFDQLSHYTEQFYYGRYDIKCTSIQDLKAGRNFSILEFNGCGAEPNHIYDCNMTLLQAYREILLHWKVLYQISRHNYKKGTPYWSFRKGWRFLRSARKHFALLEQFD